MTPDLPQLTRRTFLGNAARGIGAVALGSRLTFKFQGRHHRLTDVHGEVVKGILA